ncbi:hypothetical protein CCP1ISM_90032 [Azospirillaceae bacterium]
MAKKPVAKPSSKTKETKEIKKIICELCNTNQVSKERFDVIGKAICLECAEKDQSEMMAVPDCDKDGTMELNFVDSKTFHTYSKNSKITDYVGSDT